MLCVSERAQGVRYVIDEELERDFSGEPDQEDACAAASQMTRTIEWQGTKSKTMLASKDLQVMP